MPRTIYDRRYHYGWVRAADINRYAYQLDLKTRLSDDGVLEIRFVEVLAVLLRDSYTEDGLHALQTRSTIPSPRGSPPAVPLGGDGSILRRKSFRWEDVLPPQTSGVGVRLLRQLSEHDIIEGDPQKRMLSAKGAPELAAALREHLAYGIVQRIAIRWREKFRTRRTSLSPGKVSSSSPGKVSDYELL